MIGDDVNERLRRAIVDRSVVRFCYRNQPERTVKPFLVGIRKESGNVKLRAWWLGGYSESGEGPGWHGPYNVKDISGLVVTSSHFSGARPGYTGASDKQMRTVLYFVE